MRTCEQGVFAHVRMFAHVRAESRPRLWKRVLNRRILACSGRRTTAVFACKTSLYLFSAKSTDRSLRLASRSPRNAARKVRILACSGTRTTDSPRARSGRLHSLVLAAPAQRGPEVVPAKATCGWFWYFCHQKYRESRDDVAGVLYLFSAKRYPKTPRQMPPPTSSRLTLAPGARLKGGFKGRWAAERVISATTLSLLKPASYAGARAFSRAFVSRLRHRAGIVRRGSVFSAGQRSEHANKGCSPLFACSRVRR